MSEQFTKVTTTEFAEALAAKQSVPGGGGAAAYVGALAAALCNMTGNFTTGKKAYAEHEEDIQLLLAQGDAARARLLQLVDEDAAAFEPLSRAYGIPAKDPSRAEQLETATTIALQPPLHIMRECAHVVELLEEMRQKGSRMLQSDVGCGAVFAAAALRAAAMNVLVNTKSLADREQVAHINAEVDQLLEHVPRAKAIADTITEELRA